MRIDLTALDDPTRELIVTTDNTADYSQSDRGVIANLTTAEVLSPLFAIAVPI